MEKIDVDRVGVSENSQVVCVSINCYHGFHWLCWNPSIHLSVCLSVCLTVYLSACLSACLFSVCLPVCLIVYPYLWVSISLHFTVCVHSYSSEYLIIVGIRQRSWQGGQITENFCHSEWVESFVFSWIPSVFHSFNLYLIRSLPDLIKCFLIDHNRYCHFCQPVLQKLRPRF